MEQELIPRPFVIFGIGSAIGASILQTDLNFRIFLLLAVVWAINSRIQTRTPKQESDQQEKEDQKGGKEGKMWIVYLVIMSTLMLYTTIKDAIGNWYRVYTIQDDPQYAEWLIQGIFSTLSAVIGLLLLIGGLTKFLK